MDTRPLIDEGAIKIKVLAKCMAIVKGLLIIIVDNMPVGSNDYGRVETVVMNICFMVFFKMRF